MKKMFLVVGAMMALSSAVFAAEPKELKFCTGAEGGFYESFGTQVGGDIKKKSKGLVTVKYINTEGSVSSAQMLKDGDCDIAILQADAVISRSMPADIAISDAHQEAIYWLHSKKGVEDFADLTEDKFKGRGIAIVNGSGAEVTLRNFGIVNKDYKDLNIIGFDDWFSAAKAASEGKIRRAGNDILIAGMIYVGRPGNVSSQITDDFKEDLTIGSIKDSDFTDVKDGNGNPLYVSCKLGESNGLKTDGSFSDPKSICVRAQIVYNNELFADMETKPARELRKAIDQSIVQNVRQQMAAKK